MHNTPNLNPERIENFVEAAQLIDSHRRPIAWLLIIQIAVLGTLAVWLTGLSTAAQVAMIAMLAGLLWYGNSFWLVPFCVVVFGGQMIQNTGRQFSFTSGIHLTECVLMLLTLVASFRYIELRRYGNAFRFNASHRRLKPASNRKRPPWITLMLGQFVRRQWYHSVIAMVVAFSLLRWIPVSNYWRQELWMQPVGARFIVLALLLFFVWFICRAVMSMWDWFLLTPRLADVAFRSWANRETWIEMAGAERRRERLRLKDED